MRETFDSNTLHSQVIFLKMREKSTEELLSIWTENDQRAFSGEELDTIKKILMERLGKLPEQKIKHKTKDIPAEKKNANLGEIFGKPFFNLSPSSNFMANFFLFCTICLGFILFLSAMVEQNTKSFWTFAENATKSDIEKIEIQRTDVLGKKDIGEVLAIKDETTIIQFTEILKTIEFGYQPNRPGRQNNLRVKVWLTNNRTIEFTCYTVENQGKEVIVNEVRIEPRLYSFGSGDAMFATPDFYNWLIENGVQIQ